MPQRKNHELSFDSEVLLKNFAVSRSKLRHALHHPWAVEEEHSSDGTRQADFTASADMNASRRAKDSNASVKVAEAFNIWWRSHPMYAPVQKIFYAVSQTAAPKIIRQYPLTAVAGAALLGCAIIAVKPWRWIAHQQWKDWGMDSPQSCFSKLSGKNSLWSLVTPFLMGETRQKSATQSPSAASAKT